MKNRDCYFDYSLMNLGAHVGEQTGGQIFSYGAMEAAVVPTRMSSTSGSCTVRALPEVISCGIAYADLDGLGPPLWKAYHGHARSHRLLVVGIGVVVRHPHAEPRLDGIPFCRHGVAPLDEIKFKRASFNLVYFEKIRRQLQHGQLDSLKSMGFVRVVHVTQAKA